MGAVPLIGLGLLALNDHLLKTAWPGWFSGKLSDFAGMMFFPFLLTATYGWSRTCIDLVIKVGSSRYRPGARRLNEVQLTFAVVFSAMSLALVNLSPFFRDVYLVVLERIDLLGIWGRPFYTMDPTDCIALIALVPVWFWGARRCRKIRLGRRMEDLGGKADL